MYDDLPLFRATDPDTSVAGAKDVKPRRGSQMFQLLEQYGNHRLGLTDEEAGIHSGLAQRRACYWKRCSDLRNLGLIEDCKVRRAGSSGSQMMVCVVTVKGLELLKEGSR